MLIDVVKLSEKLCSFPIKSELKYATTKNFVGRVINGYEPDLTSLALLTPKAARKLCAVQNALIQQYHFGLLIYDAYRPKRAVQDFLHWTKQDVVNQYELERKEKHYPRIHKNQLFKLGYLSEDSNHCYGNTVDLVLIDIATNKALDMGARFDYMDTISRTTATSHEIGEHAFQHRKILSDVMNKFDFQPYIEEFWHFCHGGMKGREVSEPMDIEITSLMKGIVLE